jgi:hypothetical protein
MTVVVNLRRRRPCPPDIRRVVRTVAYTQARLRCDHLYQEYCDEMLEALATGRLQPHEVLSWQPKAAA